MVSLAEPGPPSQQHLTAPTTPLLATSAVPAVSNSLALTDLGEQMLELRGGQYDAMAAVRMIRSADEVLGTLIDTQA